jgi:hypothetical protein
MKRLSFCLVIIVALLAPLPAWAFEARRMLGPYDVGIRMSRHPMTQGDVPLEIDIKGPGGRPVTEAQVLVNYYMPPMPRMAPMNYKTPAVLQGDRYRMIMRIIMEGPWVIALKITLGGKMATVKFNVTAR